jgi:hypothetical protein
MSEGNGNGASKLGRLFIDRLKITSVNAVIWGGFTVLVVALSPWRDQILAVWRTPQRLAEMEARFDLKLDRMDDSLDEILRQHRALTGENRVVRIDISNTYVTEPVHLGERVQLVLVASRTELGRGCVLRHRTALFTDASGIALPGERVPPSRQLGPRPERMLLTLRPPDQLQPGRVAVALSLEFDCAGASIFEVTDSVPFRLLPPRP